MQTNEEKEKHRGVTFLYSGIYLERLSVVVVVVVVVVAAVVVAVDSTFHVKETNLRQEKAKIHRNPKNLKNLVEMKI